MITSLKNTKRIRFKKQEGGENMSYLVNEIYELYEKHLELTEHVLKDIGVDDNIHNYLIDVNIDLEILLESNDLIKYDHDKLEEKIKEAYDEVFKEGILFGIIVGKIIKLDNCLENKEKYNDYLEREYDYYTEYNFKIDFFKKTIPPIKIRKYSDKTFLVQCNTPLLSSLHLFKSTYKRA